MGTRNGAQELRELIYLNPAQTFSKSTTTNRTVGFIFLVGLHRRATRSTCNKIVVYVLCTATGGGGRSGSCCASCCLLHAALMCSLMTVTVVAIAVLHPPLKSAQSVCLCWGCKCIAGRAGTGHFISEELLCRCAGLASKTTTATVAASNK